MEEKQQNRPEEAAPDALPETVQAKKQEIRKRCRTLRNAMTEEERERASRQMAKAVLASETYQRAPVILAYIDAKNEISPAAILEDAWRQNKTVAVPRVHGKTMDFYQIQGFEDLEPGAFGIREPQESCPLVEISQGLMLAPGVAFDGSGRRIGYGGGFYDRYLADHPQLTVWGLAFSCQVLPQVPAEETDRRMDQVVTEKGFQSIQ